MGAGLRRVLARRRRQPERLAGEPTSSNLAGTIDDVAIYPSALTLAQVQDHYLDSGRTLNVQPAPTDAYGQAVYASSPDIYWRLDETSGTKALDTSRNTIDGTVSGGVAQGTASPVAGASGTAVTFDGSTGTVGSQEQCRCN